MDQNDTAAEAFVTWARERVVPLSIPRHDDDYEDMCFLGDVVANKRIVAFGESAHYMHEWNRWRARLFKYLAENHGFDTSCSSPGWSRVVPSMITLPAPISTGTPWCRPSPMPGACGRSSTR